ncbi:hypothetical protein BH11PSE10_BH11PSE10_18520 [soil metagenome]
MDTAALIAGFSQQQLLLHLVDLVLAVSLLELLWLVLRRERAALPQLLPNLLAGLSLSLALRLALGGAGLAWIAPCLLAAGVAHLLDLHARGRFPAACKHDLKPPAHSPAHGKQTP